MFCVLWSVFWVVGSVFCVLCSVLWVLCFVSCVLRSVCMDVAKEGAWFGRRRNGSQSDDARRSNLVASPAGSRQAMVAALLLGSGAATDVADEWGATPLHRAVLRGHRDVAERLLDTGIADVNAEDRQGERPLHIASKRGDYALAKLLLEHGGSATARTRTGATAMDCARERGHSHVVALLEHRRDWARASEPTRPCGQRTVSMQGDTCLFGIRVARSIRFFGVRVGLLARARKVDGRGRRSPQGLSVMNRL